MLNRNEQLSPLGIYVMSRHARIRRSLLALVTALSVTANSFAKEKTATVTYDPYQKRTIISGQVHDHNALFDLDKWTYWFSATITDGTAKNPVLNFSTNTPEWYFFDSAADIDGHQFVVIKGNRDLGYPGSVHELIGVEFTPAYLADHRVTGMNLRIGGSRGARVLIVPAEAIAIFETTYLAEVEKVGGFRNNLVAAQAAILPTPTQAAQAASSGARDAAIRGGFGISFVVVPQGIYLMAVAPSGRADRGHLKPGQLITAVNDKSIAGVTQADLLMILKNASGQTTVFIAGIGNVNIAP